MTCLAANRETNMTQDVRIQIDSILQQCATIFSNLGTRTPFDVRCPKIAKQREKDLLELIKPLDEEFYNTVTNFNSDASKEEALG